MDTQILFRLSAAPGAVSIYKSAHFSVKSNTALLGFLTLCWELIHLAIYTELKCLPTRMWLVKSFLTDLFVGQTGFLFPWYSSWIYLSSRSWPLVSERTPFKMMEGHQWTFLTIFVREMDLTGSAKDSFRLIWLLGDVARLWKEAMAYMSTAFYHITSILLGLYVIEKHMIQNIRRVWWPVFSDFQH